MATFASYLGSTTATFPVFPCVSPVVFYNGCIVSLAGGHVIRRVAILAQGVLSQLGCSPATFPDASFLQRFAVFPSNFLAGW